MKNVILTHNELQLNLFYAVSFGLQNYRFGENLHIIPEVLEREYQWRVVQHDTVASSAVVGKTIFEYRINKGQYQMNDVRIGVVTSYLRDQAQKFIEEFKSKVDCSVTDEEIKSLDGQIGSEESIFQSVRKMCEQSLDPDSVTFAKWEDVEKILRLTRKAQVHDKAIDIRQRPAKYTLQEIFKELKFGRPAKSQDALDRFIRELERYENEELDEKEVIAGALDEYAQMFPECKEAIRQAKIALNGEGLAFEFLPVEFNMAKGEKDDDTTPMIGDGVHDGFYGEGKTNGERAIDFLVKLLNDDQYLIVERKK